MEVNVGDILRIVAVLSWLDGDLAMNVFNAKIDGGTGPFDGEDVLSDMSSWMLDVFDSFTAQMSDEINGAEVRVYVYDTVGEDWDEVAVGPFGFNPSAADDQLPRGVALLVNCRTSDPDVNGKKYIPALTEAAVTDGLFTAGEIARAATYGADWLTDFTGGTSGAEYDPGVWSPTNSAFYSASGTIIIPSIPAYQRRRKQGVGV